MIAIASDKFKGTLTSVEAGEAIRKALSSLDKDIAVLAMADGGEGTAAALEARNMGTFYEFTDGDSIACAYVPSCAEGMDWASEMNSDPELRKRSSYPVGKAIRDALEHGYSRIYVGIGGTRTADGGLGLLQGLGYHIDFDNDGLPTAIKPPETDIYNGAIIGLADVACPLYAENGLSAMSFLAQKGATDSDTAYIRNLFRRLKSLYSTPDLHGGAGGGIGFAIETVLGCRCHDGALVILHHALSSLKRHPDLLVAGEGRIDSQTLGGKAVEAVRRYGEAHSIPVATFCGSIADNVNLPDTFACVSDGAPIPSAPYAALVETAYRAIPTIKKLLK